MSQIADGTVKFTVRDIRLKSLLDILYPVGSIKFTVRDIRLKSLLDILYPVGSIKVTVSSTAPFSDLGFGTWKEVSKGIVLWGG